MNSNEKNDTPDCAETGRADILICATCGEPAACLGRYEDEANPWEYACNKCCGHGNEDGECHMLEDVPEWIDGLFKKLNALENA